MYICRPYFSFVYYIYKECTRARMLMSTEEEGTAKKYTENILAKVFLQHTEADRCRNK